MAGIPRSGTVENDPDFGALLRRHRLSAGLTQEELAVTADVSVRTIRDLELGSSQRPQRRTAERLAAVLANTATERDAMISAARTARIVGNGAIRRAPARIRPQWSNALPRDLSDFTGRAGQLSAVCRYGEAGGTVVVSGPPGVGKTSLVVHAAHRLAPGFDGVCYSDLTDPTGTPLPPADVLARLLTALGVRTGQLSPEHGGRLAAYRRLTSDTRGILVLDNAIDADQVIPLLPGPGWLVLVSSRGPLPELSATGRLDLGALPGPAAQSLLRAAVGADRIDREPAAVAELVELCGGLPLALRIVANRLNSRPLWTIESVTVRLRCEQRRLEFLRTGDVEVRGAIAWSYRQLPDGAQRGLRRLSLLPWRDHDEAVLAALAGPDSDPGIADVLRRAGLLQPATEVSRFRLHRLVTLFGAERAAAEDDAAASAAACDRVATVVLETALPAADVLNEVPVDPARVWAGTEKAAVAWLVANRERWWWAVGHIADRGDHARLLTVAKTLTELAHRSHHLVPWGELSTRAIAAAIAVGDPLAEAFHRNKLGWVYKYSLARPADAIPEHRIAQDRFRAHGDAAGVAWSTLYIGGALHKLGRPDDAMIEIAKAVELFAAIGDDLGSAVAQLTRGDVIRNQGDPATAAQIHRAALAGLPADGSCLPRLVGMLRHRLGLDLIALRQWDEAVAVLDAAVVDHHDRNLTGTVEALLALGRALCSSDPDRAESVLTAAIEAARRGMDVLAEAEAHNLLAKLSPDRG